MTCLYWICSLGWQRGDGFAKFAGVCDNCRLEVKWSGIGLTDSWGNLLGRTKRKKIIHLSDLHIGYDEPGAHIERPRRQAWFLIDFSTVSPCFLSKARMGTSVEMTGVEIAS